MSSATFLDTVPAGSQKRALLLPPLILHPFADPAGPERLMASSHASLVLQGMLPAGDATASDLDRSLMTGRFSEVQMLYYVGKDLLRWIDQCMEFVASNAGEVPAGIQRQSFAALLVQDAPPVVEAKLRKWGVADYKSIFARAIGLNCLFADAPAVDALAGEFVRNYFRYADQLFASYQSQASFTRITAADFEFELYSSGEYTRMLERQWMD
jgi:hypothetical protein